MHSASVGKPASEVISLPSLSTISHDQELPLCMRKLHFLRRSVVIIRKRPIETVGLRIAFTGAQIQSRNRYPEMMMNDTEPRSALNDRRFVDMTSRERLVFIGKAFV